MYRIILAILLTLFFLPIRAEDVSNTLIQDQQSDQTLCVQQVVERCVEKCQETTDINCTKSCTDNATNECHEAGE